MIDMNMHKCIAVVVCTYNRAHILDRLLDSLSQQALDKSLWEIVIVDNNSSDNTKDVIAKWQRRFPLIYIEEHQQGLSYARNAGIHQSKSDYLLYLDDDVYAEKRLLETYYNYINSVDMSSIACLGGKVTVEWEGGTRPSWFPEKFENLYGRYDLGFDVKDSLIAMGGNMLWERKKLIDLGEFDVGLGRKGNIKLASEETALVQKALGLGLKIKYIPDAVVRHWTPYSRQRKYYLFELCYWLGVSKAKVESISLISISHKESIKNNIKLARNLIIYFTRFTISTIKKKNILSGSESVYWFGMMSFLAGELIQNIYSKLRKASG